MGINIIVTYLDFITATCSGVLPLLSFILTDLPDFTNSFTLLRSSKTTAFKTPDTENGSL